MRSFYQSLVIMMVAMLSTIVFIPYLFAQNIIPAENVHASIISRKSIDEFHLPFQSSLNMECFHSGIDQTSGQPVFRSMAENPDDIYWDNSMSSSIPGVEGTIYALIVYNGKLIAAGLFTYAGGAVSNNITEWDGVSWSPLGTGMNGWILSLTVYDGKLIAGGNFTTAGGVKAKSIAAWDGST
jgi:hypothetical protein